MMDLSTYWVYDHFVLTIPVPDETANINAVVKPFQWPVSRGSSMFLRSFMFLSSKFEF
jgi:hypothetical protein